MWGHCSTRQPKSRGWATTNWTGKFMKHHGQERADKGSNNEN